MNEAVAKRYAEALFDVAKENNAVDDYEKQLKLIKDTLDESEELQNVLTHPQIDKKKKKAILVDVFQKDVSEQVINLLKVLVDRQRVSIIDYLFLDFVLFANEYRGIVDMQVTTASPLTDEEKKKLTEEFGRKIDKKLRLTTNVDQDIIGGMIVKIGNRVFDSSMAGKLQRFKRELKAES